MKVGITISAKPGESIWKNGILQNAIFFYDLLEKLPSISDVSFLQCSSSDVFDKDPFPISGYTYEFFNSDTIDSIRKDYRILFSLGALPPTDHINIYKENKDNRFVQYKGGNEFINEIESVLYGQYLGWNNIELSSKRYFPSETDEVWMVPQQEFHNSSYMSIKHRTETRVVPFIWNSKFLDESANELMSKKDNEYSIYFKDKKFDEGWNWVSFEPNMSLLKNMMPILYTCEHLWRTIDNKDLIDKFMITNADGHLKNDSLVQIVAGMDIQKDRKVSFEGRYPSPFILYRYAHGVISHQWGNALNYAYLDTCYFGIPLVHNAHLCKDLGFYYEGWDLKGAALQMKKAMNTMRSNDSYLTKQKKRLKRYTIENQSMINQYDLLVKNLFNKNSIDGMRNYNPVTNLVQ